MSKYTPPQLKRMAMLALAARECEDVRWTWLLMALRVHTGLSVGEMIICLTEYAQAPQ